MRTKAQRPWTVKPSNTNLGHQNNTASTCNTHCISKPVWVHQWQGCSNSAPRCKPAITQKTKRRVRHFFRESTSNKSRSASLPGVVFGGSRVSATSFPPQGQRARSEHSLQQKQPAPPPMQSALGGAIAHKSAKAPDRHTTKPASTHLGNQSKRATTPTTKCISKPVW